jgi:hypothetical protein
LYPENYKTLLENIKEDVSKWKAITCSWIGKLSFKMSILPKVTYRFIVIPIKIPMAHFAEMEKIIIKFIRSCKGPPNS